ncbi:MAG: hypothetical protein ACRELA_06870, partial [Candidatus Rokuibacteriota bacterium]
PLLCLDEPTNHLDLASRERLEVALEEFGGTIVFISHDRYFINRLATKVIEVAGGRLTTHLGNYDDFRAAAMATTPGRATLSPPGGVRGSASRGSAAGERPVPRRRDPDLAVRDMRRRLEELESQIHALENRLRQLGETLSNPALYADGDRVRTVAAERKRAEEQVTWLLREWEDLSTALSAHE